MPAERLTWPEDSRTGIKAIDAQHDWFIELANGIIAMADDEATDEPTLERYWSELVDYAYTHFEMEEQLLKDYAYADFDEHVVAHELFRKKLKTFFLGIKKEDSDPKVMARKMAEFVRKWVGEYMLDGSETNVIAFLKSHAG